MGMLAPRMCKRCYQTAVQGTNLCAKHRAAPDTRQRSPLKKLYDCVRWRRYTRNAVLSRDPRCAYEELGTRCWRLGVHVHHVVEAEIWVAAGNDFYDMDNLVGMCQPHHNKVTVSRRQVRA
jgi:hypothetical protein